MDAAERQLPLRDRGGGGVIHSVACVLRASCQFRLEAGQLSRGRSAFRLQKSVRRRVKFCACAARAERMRKDRMFASGNRHRFNSYPNVEEVKM